MKSPLPHRKFSALDWFCLRLIAFYQRELSPRKGYRCAHALLHGGAGCSGFAHETIAQHGLRDAIPQIRARFRDCKRAGYTLRNEKLDTPRADLNPDKRARRGNRRANKSNSDSTDYCCIEAKWHLCCDAAVDCGPGDAGCCDCSPCD